MIGIPSNSGCRRLASLLIPDSSLCSCPACYLNTAKFEALVIEQIKKQVLTSENLMELVDITNRELDSNMESYQVELINLNTMTSYINEMQKVLGESTLTERRAFIRSFIREIRVKGNEAVLTYSPPIPPEMITLSGDTVPLIVHYGGR